MATVNGLLIDIDGVILRDESVLPGAVELVAWLLEIEARFLFVTNYPSQTPADLAGRMAHSGIEVPAHHFFTAAMATAEFLDKQAGTRRRAFVVGEGALVHELYKIGFTMSETEADFVVLGETRHYNFDMIQRAAALIRRGARFIATNPDVAAPPPRRSSRRSASRRSTCSTTRRARSRSCARSTRARATTRALRSSASRQRSTSCRSRSTSTARRWKR